MDNYEITSSDGFFIFQFFISRFGFAGSFATLCESQLLISLWKTQLFHNTMKRARRGRIADR
ncbi:MAG: hypothetical protein ACOX69_05480 [Coriobacteriales bacterium]